MTSSEADQSKKVEELLRKQRERTTKNFEIEQSWLVKAHDNEIARKDNRILELENQLEYMDRKQKSKNDD